MAADADAPETGARLKEWKAHWPLVAASVVCFGFYTLANVTMGVFMGPLTEAFGWTRAEITAGFAIGGVTGIFLSPFIGALIDRFGIRPVAIPGVILTALSVASLATATGSMAQWLTIWSFYAVIVLLLKATVWTTAVSGAFDAGRSLAMAVVLSGGAVTQTIGPPLANYLIDAFGWRIAYVILGLGWGAVALVCAVFFVRDANTPARKARSVVSGARDGSAPSQARPAQTVPGLSLKEAARSMPLIRIGLSTLLTMFLGIGILMHAVPIMVEAGYSREYGAYTVSLIGISGIIGKLVTGWLMDRFNAGTVGGLTIAASGLAFMLLLERFSSAPVIVFAMVVIGYAGGTKLHICAYLTSCYAGLRNYGKIFGVMSSLIAFGGGVGPVVAGAAYDAFGSYEPFIYVAVVGTLLSASLLFGLSQRGTAPRPADA